MRVLFALLSLVIVGLAGCTDGDEPEPVEVVDTTTFELEAGKGAIAGLLVDDRFRPIQLTDSPQTEFQTTGFVLLQETGQQSQTNENGEFTFVDLEPGQYTLRATLDGHEATPQRVTVAEGVFNEASVVARRISSETDAIITEEYTAFVGCQVSAPAVTAQCDLLLLDQSGDTSRQQFNVDYSAFDTELVVIEMLSNKEASRDGALKIVTRDEDGCYTINDAITEGNYLKVWWQKGEVSPHDLELRNCAWENTGSNLIQIWAQGILKDETQEATALICLTGQCAGETADSRGVGLQAGVVVRFLVTVFLGEPPVAPEDYCALC